MPGSIHQLDQVLLPARFGHCRSDGDTVDLLLRHVIHVRSPVMHFTDLVECAGVEQDTFRQRGLAGVYMRGYADVAYPRKITAAGHLFPPPGYGRAYRLAG